VVKTALFCMYQVMTLTLVVKSVLDKLQWCNAWQTFHTWTLYLHLLVYLQGVPKNCTKFNAL